MGKHKKMCMALAVGLAAITIAFTDAKVRLNRIQEAMGKQTDFSEDECMEFIIVYEERPGRIIYIVEYAKWKKSTRPKPWCPYGYSYCNRRFGKNQEKNAIWR